MPKCWSAVKYVQQYCKFGKSTLSPGISQSHIHLYPCFCSSKLDCIKGGNGSGFFFLLCFAFFLPFFLSIFLLLVSNFHFFMFVLAFKLSVSCLLLIFYFYFLIFFSFLLFFVKGSMSKHKKSCFCSFGFLDCQMNYGIIK